MNSLFLNVLKNHGQKAAIHFEGKTLTYHELYTSAIKVANALIESGVKQETRVALLMSNRMEYVIAEMGLYMAGGAKVPLNDMLGEQEIHYILNHSETFIAIADENFFEKLHNIQDRLPHLNKVVALPTSTTEIPDVFVSWENFLAGASDSIPEITIDPQNIAKIGYTGGTTGKPKGVVHTHQTAYFTIISIILEANIQEDEKILLMTPLPHAAGLYLLAGLVRGAEVFIERKFNVPVLLEHVEKNKITYLSLVPTMIYRILDYMEGKQFNTNSVRTIQYGTAPITMERLKQGIKTFGPVFTQIYGLTETQGAATWLRKRDHTLGENNIKLLTSCGKSTAFTRIKIVDDFGNERLPGEEGEIVVSAVTNMIGYHKMPEKTAEALRDGWLFTGDVGMVDQEGYLYLLDRKKDMIISGGLNVYCSEVENVIQKHSSVSQVAVIGIPDDEWGEIVAAFVIPKKGETISMEELNDYCRKNLAAYKKPKLIEIVSSLPLTAYGKVDKKRLRAPHWDLVDRQI